MSSLTQSQNFSELLLAALTLAPLAIAWLLGLFPSRAQSDDGVQERNPLSQLDEIDVSDPVLAPAVHQSRTLPASDLHGLALGLRHASVEKAAPLLLHLMTSADPELSLYAQSILQQSREKLLSAMQPALDAAQHGSARAAAAHLETGLRLASTTLASDAERATMLAHLSSTASGYISTHEPTPRLIAIASRIFIAAHAPEKAAALADLLPASSPLFAEIVRVTKFSLHQKRVALAATPTA